MPIFDNPIEPLNEGEGYTPPLPVTARYAVYRLSDGYITRRGAGQPEVVNEQYIELKEGEALWVSTEANLPDHAYMVNGQPVEYTPEQVAAKRTRPAGADGWDNNAMAWKMNLGAVRHNKRQAIHQLGVAAESEVVPYSGDTWDADAESRVSIVQKIEELEDITQPSVYPELLQWRSATNVTRIFPSIAAMRVFLRGLLAAISKRNSLVKAKVWSRKDALAATADSAVTDFDPSLV